MAAAPSPELLALFGSATRVRTLATLAHASGPLTGYRIARLSGLSPTKTYAELHRLQRANIVLMRPTSTGRRGWQLADPDVGAFIRRRARLPGWEPADDLTEDPARSSRVGRPSWRELQFPGFSLPRAAPPPHEAAAQEPEPEPEPLVPAPPADGHSSPKRRRR